MWGDVTKRVQKRKEAAVHITQAGEQKEAIKEKQVTNTFRQKLEMGELVCAVELDPPFDTDDTKLLNGAKALLCRFSARPFKSGCFSDGSKNKNDNRNGCDAASFLS